MRTRLCALAGAALVLPAFLFLSASVLKDEFGAPFLYDSLESVIPIIGSPLVILGGLLGAAALNLWPMVRVSLRREPGSVVGTLTVRPQGWNIAVLAVSAGLLAIICSYLLVENLGHRAAGF